MGKNERELREFATAIDQVTLHAQDISFESLIRQLQSIEEAYMLSMHANPKLALEVQRRIAERIFTSAVTRNEPFETCKRFFEIARELGFARADRELTFHIIFARCALEAKQPNEGIEALRPLRRKWKRAVRENKDRYSKHDVALAEGLLSQLGRAVET